MTRNLMPFLTRKLTSRPNVPRSVVSVAVQQDSWSIPDGGGGKAARAGPRGWGRGGAVRSHAAGDGARPGDPS